MTGKGSSGASVSFTKINDRDVAVKYGNVRVSDQGRYLMAIESMAVPKVYSVSEQGYTMERLIPVSNVSPYDVYRRLALHVWSIPQRKGVPTASFQKELLQLRLLRGITSVDPTLREAYDLGPMCADISEFLANIHESYYIENGTRPFTIHGDPTLENVMYRRGKGEGLVLIDPIPPQAYAPSLREVDLGKIAQSLAGFEHDRYGFPGIFDQSELIPWVQHVCNEEHVIPEVVLDWAIVHIVRAFPYMPRRTHVALLEGTLARLRKAVEEVVNARRVRSRRSTR